MSNPNATIGIFLINIEKMKPHFKLTNQSIFVTKLLFGFLLLIMASSNSYSQREADIWYFDITGGLDFSTGEPQVLSDGYPYSFFSGAGTICDSISNLLFFTNHYEVYNSQHELMENGEDFVQEGSGVQSNVIFPWPESDSLYFIIRVWDYNGAGGPSGLSYNVVDMSLNDGLGAVVVKDVTLNYAWDASNQVVVARHANKRDVWIITRKYVEGEMAAFLVTPDGINETPVLSTVPNYPYFFMNSGSYFMRLSYDKKFIFTSINGINDLVQMCEFNSETGEVVYIRSHENDYGPVGIEFSPDSKFVYISYENDNNNIKILQYEMQYIYDFQPFRDSEVNIGGVIGRTLQLATDGKIYCLGKLNSASSNIGVIHKPWLKGMDCDYNSSDLSISPGFVHFSRPVMLLDYLYRFEFDGTCQGEPFHFTSNFNPIPSSIYWTFNDPSSPSGNNSSEINPEHIFSAEGIFEVEVDVWYPSGRFEHTSRLVEVEAAPMPDIGPDTSMCINADIILDADCGQYNYVWSTGQSDTSRITVSDSGWYWVNVSDSGGCSSFDSIHISYFPTTSVNTTNIIISPTTCAGSEGAIRGIELEGLPPLTYYWTNDIGDTIAGTLDIYHLTVGNYMLHVLDGNGCSNTFDPISIQDAGDVLIEQVTYSNEHCNQQDGYINVQAVSGLGDMLFYSIDYGFTWESNIGVFNNLPPGNYAVQVQDSSSMCQDVYDGNPIVILNELHPDITNIQVTPETSGMNDGMIAIEASSSGDTIYYSIDNGITSQINSGVFGGLSTGFYTCLVSDEYGCDTTFIVEVSEIITTFLEAIAGNDTICPGKVAHIPIMVTNFAEISEFKSTLLYNSDLINCTGYTNTNAMIEDSLVVMLFPLEEKIEIKWTASPITIDTTAKILDLVFDASTPNCIGHIDWDDESGANEFINASGNQVPVNYQFGELIIFNDLSISTYPPSRICSGDSINISTTIWSSNGSVSYEWVCPDGNTINNSILNIEGISPDQSGMYSLTVTDSLMCIASKEVELIVNEIPSPQFAIEDTIFTEDPIDLDAGYGFQQYWWNTGDTTQTIWVENEGWYTAEVESVEGCIGEDSSFVVFKTTPELIIIYFPNAFTPNGDGLNDEFKVVAPSANIEVFSLSIFNRWGAQIFQTNDITEGWDGTYQGNICQPGSFVFKVSYNTSLYSSTPPEVKIGTVTLVR